MNRIVAPESIDDADVDCLLAMLRQEEGSYSYKQCLSRGSNFSEAFGGERLNTKWREKICQWSYNVVDHFGLCREVVGISMNLFDRYLATKDNRCNGNIALLTSLTTLHIAIKLEDSRMLPLDVLSELSRGQFSREDIDKMEWSVLSELQWKVHPPTLCSFLAQFVMLLPEETSMTVRQDIEDLSRYICELAVYDSFLVGMKSSTICYAAILNVMDDMDYSRLTVSAREQYVRDINRLTGLSCYSDSVLTARHRLRNMFVGSYTNGSSGSYSPQSVGYASTNIKISRSVSSGTPLGEIHMGRSRSNSFENKCDYSGTRRCVAVSPICSTSRAHRTFSPLESVH